MLQDAKVAASSYVLGFLVDLDTLTNNWAIYQYHLSYLYSERIDRVKLDEAIKSKADDVAKIMNGFFSRLDDNQKEQLKDITNNLRFYISKIYVKFCALKKEFKAFKQKEQQIDLLFNSMTSVEAPFLPDVKKVEEYCLVLNECLADAVVRDALIKADEVYSAFKDVSGGQEND